jgi:hypothetical protein
MALVGKAAREGDFRDCQSLPAKERLGARNALFQKPSMRRHADALPKRLAEMGVL